MDIVDNEGNTIKETVTVQILNGENVKILLLKCYSGLFHVKLVDKNET